MANDCDFGLIGLAVMGENLAMNIESRGYRVAVFNRTTSVVDRFIQGRGKGKNFVGCHSEAELVEALKPPRKVMMMVKAGSPVDQVIDQLKPLLSKGDIIIDGGNSFFMDTQRRSRDLEGRGLSFIGMGVSGGEEGALHGPSLMPGGSEKAWPEVKELLQAISAKVGPNNDVPCCDWIGPDGSGHYVKMVHNGIEYGDMQLISESYLLLSRALGLSNDQLYDVFAAWNKSELDSYLIEITRDIFSVKDPDTGNYLLDMVLDSAGSKGTGKWMSQNALDLGAPTTLITEAVYARYLSALKAERERASKVLTGPKAKYKGDQKKFIEAVRQALYASKICSYAQGFFQLEAAAREFGWKLDYGRIALLWRGGCIIRARFLESIKAAFDADPNLENLLLADEFRKAVEGAQDAWRHVVAQAVELGVAVPGFAAALTYYDGYREPRGAANLIQAQRDYFGAHTYQRIDKQGTFHSDWLRMRREPTY